MTQSMWAREHLWYRKVPGMEPVLTEWETLFCARYVQAQVPR